MKDNISTDDRLSVTVIFALLLHSVIVLGVSFGYEDPEKPENLPALDVILVQRRSEKPPDKADYLAQVSQEGGGTRDRRGVRAWEGQVVSRH